MDLYAHFEPNPCTIYVRTAIKSMGSRSRCRQTFAPTVIFGKQLIRFGEKVMRRTVLLVVVVGFVCIYAFIRIIQDQQKNSLLDQLDRQFASSRQIPSPSQNEVDLLPQKVGSFVRSTNIVLGDQPYGGIYNDQLHFNIWKLSDQDAKANALLTPISCGDAFPLIVKHLNDKIEYTYGVCPSSVFGSSLQGVIWINGNWAFNITSPSLENLVSFISNYPY